MPAINDAGMTLIKTSEGLHDGNPETPVLEPILCPAGVWTVGWGHALFIGGRHVRDEELAYSIWRQRWPRGMTRQDADELAESDISRTTGRVRTLLRGTPVSGNELAAMVSLAYNIGVGIEGDGIDDFADSTVLRRFRAGRKQEAADAFLLWNKMRVNGVLTAVRGLTNRRERERALFLTPGG